MAIFGEFRDFAFKGNVIDLAVGVIIGAAFGKIVTSLVNNIFMPILGLILGRVDFSNLWAASGLDQGGGRQRNSRVRLRYVHQYGH